MINKVQKPHLPNKAKFSAHFSEILRIYYTRQYHDMLHLEITKIQNQHCRTHSWIWYRCQFNQHTY